MTPVPFALAVQIHTSVHIGHIGEWIEAGLLEGQFPNFKTPDMEHLCAEMVAAKLVDGVQDSWQAHAEWLLGTNV